MTEGQGFEARCEQRDGVVIVIARGELDLESAGELTAVLDRFVTEAVPWASRGA